MTSPASARPTSPARGIDDRATNAGLFEAARAVREAADTDEG